MISKKSWNILKNILSVKSVARGPPMELYARGSPLEWDAKALVRLGVL